MVGTTHFWLSERYDREEPSRRVQISGLECLIQASSSTVSGDKSDSRFMRPIVWGPIFSLERRKETVVISAAQLHEIGCVGPECGLTVNVMLVAQVNGCFTIATSVFDCKKNSTALLRHPRFPLGYPIVVVNVGIPIGVGNGYRVRGGFGRELLGASKLQGALDTGVDLVHSAGILHLV